MIDGIAVTPSQLRVAGARVRSSGRQLAVAGRALGQALDSVRAQRPGSVTAPAALGLASAARVNVDSLSAGIEALAQSLDAAATRYASTDTLLATIAGRR